MDKAIPAWVNRGVGRLFVSDPDAEQADTGLPPPSPGRKPSMKPQTTPFPDVVKKVALFTGMHAQMNRGRCKAFAEKLKASGRPTYESVKGGTSAISTADLAAIWTNHRVKLLRSGKKLQQVIATIPGLWMRHLAHPDDGLAEMRHAFEHDTAFDPGPDGFDRILGHIMEEVERQGWGRKDEG